MRHAFRIPQSEFRIRADAYGQVTVLHGADDADGAVTEWEEDTGGSDGDNRVLFAGYRFDAETGLYHVRHRMYHGTLGRWIQRDPAGYVDGMGLYEYGRSSPSNQVDPRGLWIGPNRKGGPGGASPFTPHSAFRVPHSPFRLPRRARPGCGRV